MRRGKAAAFSKFAYLKYRSTITGDKEKQETQRVVTIAMICSTLGSLGKFQYFWRSIYNPVKQL